MTLKSLRKNSGRRHQRDPFESVTDEFLDYYRQYRHPSARPDGYEHNNFVMNQPIRSYHRPDSHYREKHPSSSPTGVEEMDADDRLTVDMEEDIPSQSSSRTSFRNPKKWCSAVLGSLKKRRAKNRGGSRPSLSRIPCRSLDNFIGGEVYDFESCYSTLPPAHQGHFSAASLVSSDVDSQSRDSGHSSGTGSLPTIDFNKDMIYKYHDNHSIYSYNTARDEADSGVGGCIYDNNSRIHSEMSRKLQDWKFEDPKKEDEVVKTKITHQKPGICRRTLNCAVTILKMLMMMVSLSVLFIILISFLRNYKCSTNLEMSKDVNVDVFAKVFNDQLFGQTAAIQKILQLLRSFYSTSDYGNVMVLILAGASGVGKTHTLSLMKSVFPVPSNVHSFSSISQFFQDSDEVLDDLARMILRDCGVKLVTFDDYNDGPCESRSHQDEKLVRFINKISKAENKTIVMMTTTMAAKEITNVAMEEAMVINGIPQFSDPNDKSYLKMSEDIKGRLGPLNDMQYSDAQISVEVVPFLPLGRESVRKCVAWTLVNKHNLHLPRFEIRKAADMILEQLQFHNSDFPIFSTSGCKQVASKVDLLFDTGTGRPDSLKEL